MKEQLKLAVDLVRDTAHNYAQDKGPMLAASLAYYTIFSLAPLIVLTVALASFFVGEQAVAGKLVLQIDDVVGADAARAVLPQNVQQRRLRL
jgi:membrane protein